MKRLDLNKRTARRLAWRVVHDLLRRYLDSGELFAVRVRGGVTIANGDGTPTEAGLTLLAALHELRDTLYDRGYR